MVLLSFQIAASLNFIIIVQFWLYWNRYSFHSCYSILSHVLSAPDLMFCLAHHNIMYLFLSYSYNSILDLTLLLMSQSTVVSCSYSTFISLSHLTSCTPSLQTFVLCSLRRQQCQRDGEEEEQLTCTSRGVEYDGVLSMSNLGYLSCNYFKDDHVIDD